MKLIDTDILIDHFHGHQAALDFLVLALSSGEDVAVSAVTVTELLGGMRVGEEVRTERLLSLFRILTVDEMIARRAATYLRRFRYSHRLDLGDAIIAATAVINEAQLITRNVKHYPMGDIIVTVPYQRGGNPP